MVTCLNQPCRCCGHRLSTDNSDLVNGFWGMKYELVKDFDNIVCVEYKCETAP